MSCPSAPAFWIPGGVRSTGTRESRSLTKRTAAVVLLNRVARSDPQGPLADKALFLVGSVHFYRERYLLADSAFSRIVDSRSKSPVAPQAAQYAIISKALNAEGPEKRRRLLETLRFIDKVSRAYPEHWKAKADFLPAQRNIVLNCLAVLDFAAAESLRRTGFPLLAYCYCEFIQRSYPGTPFALMARNRQREVFSEKHTAVSKKAEP